MTEFLNTYCLMPWNMSNFTTNTVGSNEAKKDCVDKLLQLQACGYFVFCAYFFVEWYTP